MKPRLALAAALALPILMLTAMTIHHHWQRAHGRIVELPVQGFDPRDLLAGHYLRYRIDYGVGTCIEHPNSPRASICLEPHTTFSNEVPPPDCTLFIRGQCRNRRFEAGIERYYIPAESGPALEKLLRNRHAAIRLSITTDGNAAIQALLIDGKVWTAPD